MLQDLFRGQQVNTEPATYPTNLSGCSTGLSYFTILLNKNIRGISIEIQRKVTLLWRGLQGITRDRGTAYFLLR